MPISLPCPRCNALLSAPDAAAGRTLNCPACQNPVPIPRWPHQSPPNERATAQEQRGNQDFEDIEDALDVLEEVPEEQERHPDFDDIVDAEDADDIMDAEDVDDIVDAEDVEDAEDIETLEEVVPLADGDFLDRSRLLAQREIHIRARQYGIAEKYIDQDLRDYDLCHARSGKRLGKGREERDMATQVARLFGGAPWVSKYLVIREGRHGDLLGSIHRAPRPFGIKQVLEICDGEDRPIGCFERSTWAALTRQTLWISSPSGRRRILQMRPHDSLWGYVFLTPGARVVGELLRAEQGTRIHWVKLDASSWHLRFRPSLDGRPRDKLLCLAVALGLEA